MNSKITRFANQDFYEEYFSAGGILWQDDDLLVVNKPAGLLTIQDGYRQELPDIRRLFANFGRQVWIVHRLDRETSGVLLMALNARAHKQLNGQFEDRCIQKEYHAILMGNPPDWHTTSIDARLRINGDRKHRTIADSINGRPARTDFQVICSAANAALISARPHSGYRHQIRAHLNCLGYTILNEPLYGHPDNYTKHAPIPAISRLALHAHSIECVHPSNGEKCQFAAPYPEDFGDALQQLNLI